MAGEVIVGDLSRKRTVRKLSGQLVDLLDEANGGWIIKGGQIVNQTRYDELRKIEEDKAKAGQAQHHAVVPPPDVQEMREGKPNRMENIEKRIEDTEKKTEDRLAKQDEKLDAILNLLKGNVAPQAPQNQTPPQTSTGDSENKVG